MQAFEITKWWDRYGRTEIEDNEFFLALDRLPSVTEAGPWVAGGSVRRLAMRLPQDSDFDFFFHDEAQFDAFCADMRKLGASVEADSAFNVTFSLPKAKAQPIGDDEFSKAGPELKVQAIRIAYFETLSDVLESFDFSICQGGWDGKCLWFGEYTLFDLSNKRLIPGTIRYGASTLRRIIKYANQGYTICGGGLANILEQVVAKPEIINAEVEYVD